MRSLATTSNVRRFVSLLMFMFCLVRCAASGSAQSEPGQTIAGSMPELGELESGNVDIRLYEQSPVQDRWPAEAESLAKPSLTWQSTHFFVSRLPLRYDDWGIRDSWQAPLLLRVSADVKIPQGNHRLLLRARALSRLWIDGRVAASTDALSKSPPDGEEPITPIPTPIVAGMRLPGYRQQEVVSPLSIESDSTCRVVLEVVVGGKGARTETGEVCVAIQREGCEHFELLRPTASRSENIRLIDAEVEPLCKSIERQLAAMDTERRHSAEATRDEYWKKRRDYVQRWLNAHPAPSIPTSGNDAAAPSVHPIDAFIVEKINKSLSSSDVNNSPEARNFNEKVLPLLRAQCFRCHADKANGGLRLNTREAALAGGDSGVPAIQPGDSEASELLRRIASDDESERMPPGDKALTKEQIELVRDWIKQGAQWYARPVQPEDVKLPPVIDDEKFLRRVYFDAIGLPPTDKAVHVFLADQREDKRQRLIRELLADSRLADQWMPYWQDVLAENPTIINASLNSTGPFRWFIYDSLIDNKPVDRWVTELIMMRGNAHEGGSAGFGLAGENDAPMATKAQIIGSAFLGIEMQCARCHDSPFHSTLQKDLYSLAAYLERKAVTVPKTSSVPVAFFEKKARESLIKVTLPTGQSIDPAWPFADETGSTEDDALDELLEKKDDSRERLAALITSPTNHRFAQVFVNRVWKQLMGAGFVEPVQDWEGRMPSHPELLQWLAHDFMTHGYDMRHLLETIMTSQAYSREAIGRNATAEYDVRFFNAPDRRRMTSEQIVDSLYFTAGMSMDVEELTFVHDGRRPMSSRLTLGRPTRAWMMANLANERDRPSLTLPKAVMVGEVMEAFGWTGARQSSINQREGSPTAIQPGVLSNSVLSVWVTRVAAGSKLADIALNASSPDDLVQQLFLRYLSRRPSESERKMFVAELSDGFADRVIETVLSEAQSLPPPLPLVTWFNHLQSEANLIQQEHERRVAAGPPVDVRLNPQWRERLEDTVWSLINHREFVWMP